MPVSAAIAGKAARYLVEGRLTVHARSGPTVQATCRGSEAEPYQLGYNPEEGWHCDCPAHVNLCAHVFALKLVIATPPEGAA